MDDHEPPEFDGDDFSSQDSWEDATGALDDRESALVRQDLVDLDEFERAFDGEGYKGVSVWCADCAEDHFYPWQMLRQNLTALLETGETPVHEPAFRPNADAYIPWEYARGYVDALRDAGVELRRPMDLCPRCGLDLQTGNDLANFCPRCGSNLLGHRLAEVLSEHGLAPEQVEAVLREAGL